MNKTALILSLTAIALFLAAQDATEADTPWKFSSRSSLDWASLTLFNLNYI
jgi:hypothetical protein